MEKIQFIQTTPEELKALLLSDIKNELDVIKNNFQPKEPEEYLTRQEVAEMLKIDLSTVHNWTKKGKLNSYGIGNRVYYMRSEVEESIVRLNK